MPERPLALFAMSPASLSSAFPPELRDRLQRSVRIDASRGVTDFADPGVRQVLGEVEILVTGWGCPRIDATVLDAAPRLKAVIHAAGSVKSLLDPGGWERGLVVCSAAAANALPVAEYTLGMIMLAGKDLFAVRESYRRRRTFTVAEILPGVGNFGRRVGIVGASRIGRRVIELLRPFDFEVLLADPYVTPAGARDLGVELLPLHDLLRRSEVVSLHAPAVEETHHLIGREELALLPDGAVLINTARGSLIDHEALLPQVRSARISAVLDVTEPEPLPADSPFFDVPGVFLTPHVAGSQGNEVRRLGLSAVEEVERFLAGAPLAHQVDPATLGRAA